MSGAFAGGGGSWRGWVCAAFGVVLWVCAGSLPAEEANEPQARFRGGPTYDLVVTNVKWEAGGADYSTVTFDLSWSFSWRAKWVEPAATSATGKDMEVENWDAVWVFVKFLAEPDVPRNYWRHASLTPDPAQNTMPAGATNAVRLSEDGRCALGAYIYRAALGHGANDWKGVKLRWMHGLDKVDPAKARVAVHPIAMVYVPEGAFKVGSVEKSGFGAFSDGPDIPVARYDGEQSLLNLPLGLRKAIETVTSKDGGPYLQWDEEPKRSCLTDGGWRGGPTIPFLLDAEWNGPVSGGSRARRLGPVAGQLWSTHTFSERGGTSGGMFGSGVGGNEPLNNDYPTGYEAFYCMKYELTQGQYVDFLNSLPPDVAAGRAFVGREVSSDAGMHVAEVKLDQGPGKAPVTVTERGGHTIYSSADLVAAPSAPEVGSSKEGGHGGVTEEEEPDREAEALAASLMTAVKEKEKEQAKKKGSGKPAVAESVAAPVYGARCPFRRIPGVTASDSYAYAVWAGLRMMTALESVKADVGVRDPVAPADWAPPKDYKGPPVLVDAGLPTERYASGNSQYGYNVAMRVGCRSTPTSDRGTACATYWGISELAGPALGLAGRGYRATHGNGVMPAGTPGASFARLIVPFKDIPSDWPEVGAYTSGHFVGGNCRLVGSVGRRIRNPDPKPVAKRVRQPAPVVRSDLPKVTNVKWEAGKGDSSYVTFDLAWDNSWRAAWTEPAEKNVTGKPLAVESWDAAWVFVKFRQPGRIEYSHATLSTAAVHHVKSAGAALDVGLTDDGKGGTGVFIYRSAVGTGANSFKGIKLRWLHGQDKADPAKVELAVHALGMVYVPAGAFASRSPWGHPLKIISTPDATQPGGHLDSGPETVPQNASWPNGYKAFYCMKYSITQGQYAEMLNSVALQGAPWYNGGRYGCMAMENFRRHTDGLYNFNGHTIRYVPGEARYEVDVPDRWCQWLSLPDIISFTAWAGLRMPSNLEYEKACRGPRAVSRGADAWAPATCAPAAGLGKGVLATDGSSPSYWGIRELSLSGCVQEWPSVLQNEPANKEFKQGCCSATKGLHGDGSPNVPGDGEWPWTAFGEWYYGGIWRLWGYGTIAQWIDPSDTDTVPWAVIDACRTGRYGARAVRTAP